MLSQLPREILLQLFVQFLSGQDAFYLRFACKAVSPIASRAFEAHIRRMIEQLDPNLLTVVKTIREKGLERVGVEQLFQDEYCVGRSTTRKSKQCLTNSLEKFC